MKMLPPPTRSKRRTLSFALFTLTILVLSGIVVADDSVSFRSSKASAESSWITTDVENDAALLVAPIRSETALETHLMLGDLIESPLGYLDPQSKQKFLNSLVFTPVGLASFDHTVFATLTPTQAYQVLSLFGLQHALYGMNTAPPQTSFDEALLASEKLQWNSCIVAGTPPIPGGMQNSGVIIQGCTGENLDIAQDSKCTAWTGGTRRCVGPATSTCRISTCR